MRMQRLTKNGKNKAIQLLNTLYLFNQIVYKLRIKEFPFNNL